MKKIVVIGSNSFSGSDFIDYLLEKPRLYVIGISRSAEKSELFLPYKKRKKTAFRFFQMDLNKDMRELLDLLDDTRPEWIANFATQSEVAPSWQHPEHWFQTNGVAFAELLNHLRNVTYLKKYLHVSTPEVYGSCRGSVKEEAPYNPSTPYAVSRAAQDMMLKIYRERFSFPYVSVRSANVFGAHQQLWKIIVRSVIYLKMNRKIELHGGGYASRSFIHIRDVSRAEYLALSTATPGSIYNLATGINHKIRDVVKLIAKKMGRDFKTSTVEVGERPGADAAYTLDSSRARKDLGWKPEISLEEGIDQVIRWVDENWAAIQKAPLEYVHKP